jgi:UDP-glucose 4-epimerase
MAAQHPSDVSYILFGGSGFIGKGIRRVLAQTQTPTILIGRSVSMPHAAHEQYYSLKDFSLAEIQKLLPQDRDYVIVDLAYTSVPNTSFDDPIKDFSENLYSVIRHLNLAREIKLRKYVYVSSGGTVYGSGFTAPIPESAPNFPIAPYGITKMACERYVHMYHQIYGLPTLIVRPSNVYGPEQVPFRGQGFIATAMGLAAQGNPVKIFGDGSIVRDYIHIDDFCSALFTAIEYAPQGGIYNIASGKGLTINAVIAAINNTLNAESVRLTAEYLPARNYDVPYNVLDCTRLTELDGWGPEVSFETGLQATWTWIKQYLKSSH